MRNIKTFSIFDIILIFILVLLGLTLFYHLQVDDKFHQKRIELLSSIQQETTYLIQNTLLIEGGAIVNFDRVAKNEKKIQSLLEEISEQNTHAQSLVQSVHHLIELASQIKSTYSIYHNSLLFFPKGIALLRSNIEREHRNDFLKHVDNFEKTVLVFNIDTSNEKNKTELINQISVLKTRSTTQPKAIRTSAERLLRHSNIIIEYSITLHQLNIQLLTSAVAMNVQKLSQVYNDQHKGDITLSILIKDALYLNSFVLILFVIYIWWKQQNHLFKKLRHQAKKLKLLARVFSDTHEAITISDADGIIIDVNPTFLEITGFDKDEVVGKNSQFFNFGKQKPGFYDDVWKTVKSKGYWHGELWNQKKNKEEFAALLSISSLKNEKSQILNYVSIFTDITDITDKKRYEENLEKMAHFDGLTQLPNRSLFDDRFEQALARSKRNNTMLAICFLDLDKFKPVNDTYGHDIGDLLLIEVATRLKNVIRNEDTISRQGGDEFALLLNDLHSIDECKIILDRAHQTLAKPYHINEHILNIGASSGVTLFPQNNSDAKGLLHDADQAMYQAKKSGRNQYFIHNEKSFIKS